MFKSILLAFTLTLAAGLSASPPADALSFGGFGGVGSGSSSCWGTAYSGCRCKCAMFGNEFGDCTETVFFNRYGDFCSFCSGSQCASDFSGLGAWSFIV